MRIHRDERGASAVIVVVSLAGLLSAATLSVDAGSVWRTRRNLITDTDAGALAAARKLDALGARACDAGAVAAAEAEARDVIAQNDAASRVTGFTVTPTNGNCSAESGRVRVDARLDADLTFAGIFGVGNVDVASSSIAQWGPLASTNGLRPIGICDKSDHFLEWKKHLAGDDSTWGVGPNHRIGPNGEIIHRVEFQRGSSGCGSASGNWDWLDFNASASPNGTSALNEWLRNGYQGEISLGDAETGMVADCNPEEPGSQPYCDPKTGATGAATVDALEFLRDNKVVFPILVYDKVVDKRDTRGCESTVWDGSGSNARFCHVAFLLVQLHGWHQITGNDGAFELEFKDEWWVGTIGRNPGGGRPTAHGVSLCGGGYGTSIDQQCDV